MTTRSLASYIEYLLTPTTPLRDQCTTEGNEPTDYGLFDADGLNICLGEEIAFEIPLFPFELLWLAQMLREGDLVILVRQDDMTPGLGISHPGHQRNMTELAKAAHLIMWHKDGVRHVLQRDNERNPFATCELTITTISPLQFHHIIEDGNMISISG
jgi:hypothetical protein